MQLTNVNNYPKSLVLAVENDPYSRGDCEYSATSLITPPRILALREKHKDEIVMDIDSKLFVLYGQIGHGILERAGKGLKRTMTEERLFGTIDGVKISAQIDSLDLEDDGTLTDYKFTTVYGFMLGSKPKSEWIKQLNIQLELLRQNGLDAKKLRICGLLRDWRPGEAKKDPKYPKKVAYHEIRVASRSRTGDFIKRTIAAHQAARQVLPLCDSGDHWSYKRCEGGYCEVSSWCQQYTDYKEKRRDKNEILKT